ncbi:MAG: anaerobic ribonucleoside-triphosphate reductase activating protein [Bacteroidales bacterium]|nr:anaerobic ribonucleoside-triphosphate reductase activating protein [Bacteroidales bacterium]MBR3427958.1 anaerobic ribonucleoside-triphosphate reductase activating protein [Bacteroidales bacterium]
MLKYANFDIVFQEVPDEVTLAINISNCPNQCPGCHSKYLWENIGKALDSEELDRLVTQYKSGITCVCFMGGDNEPDKVAELARKVKNEYKGLKAAWYSGKNELPENVKTDHFDYIKLGSYVAELGALDSVTTNQRMMKRLSDGRVKDITEWFRKNKSVNQQQKETSEVASVK